MLRITDLSFDIQTLIMTCLGDLESLQSLLTAIPAMKGILSSSFCTITNSTLPISYRQREILTPLYACLAAHYRNPVEENDLIPFLATFFGDDSSPIALPPDIPRDRASLDYIMSVYQTVEKLLPCTWPLVLGIPSPWCLTSEPIYFGARRALLRIQLYTELFHQRLDDIDDWEPLRLDISLFWSCFSTYDGFRCHHIYATLLHPLRQRLDKDFVVTEYPKYTRLRGLPLLLSFIDGNPTTSYGLQYITLLVAQDSRVFNVDSGYGRRDFRLASAV